jgi:hypothetical protein
MIDIAAFRWQYPVAGFQWTKLPKPLGWSLTDNPVSGYMEYQPLQCETGLYMKFRELDAFDRDAILDFANQYGSLGDTTPADEHPLSSRVEKHGTWVREIMTMRRAVDLWQMVKSEDAKSISNLVKWFPGRDAWRYTNESDGYGISSEIEPVENLFDSHEALTPAAFCVQRWINQRLEKFVSPQLLYDVQRASRVVRVIPRTLLGAMWLQFAWSVDGARSHKPCKECGRWFEISTEDTGKRINREFCSDPCKSKNYRRRKAEAIELKAQGKTIAAIAKQLDTPIETIKNWTSKRKG